MTGRTKAELYEDAKKEFENALRQRELARAANNMVLPAHEAAVSETKAALLKSLENYYRTSETPEELNARVAKIEKEAIAALNTPTPAAVPAPAPTPAAASAPAANTADADSYKKATIELRRNFIDTSYGSAEGKAAAAAKTAGVEQAFKDAHKKVAASDAEQAMKDLRAQFKQDLDASQAAYDALKDAVTKQLNGDASVTAEVIADLRTKRIEARLKGREGIETREEATKIADQNILEIKQGATWDRLKAAVEKQKAGDPAVTADAIGKLTTAYVDARVAATGETRPMAEGLTEHWVSELKRSPEEAALVALRRATFNVTVAPDNEQYKKAAPEARAAYIAALKAAKPGETDQQREAAAKQKIEEFTGLAKAFDKAYVELKDTVKKQVQDNASVSDGKVRELRKAYIDTRLKALEGVISLPEAEARADENIASFKKEAAGEKAKAVSEKATKDKAYADAREAYRKAVVERVKHENIDTYDASLTRRAAEEKAQEVFLAVQPAGKDAGASKENVAQWKSVYEGEGKRQQIKVKMADGVHKDFKPNKNMQAKDIEGETKGTSVYERALKAMKKEFPTQEFTALGDLAPPAAGTVPQATQGRQ